MTDDFCMQQNRPSHSRSHLGSEGFSLVEVSVGLGLAGLLTLGSAALMNQMAQSTKADTSQEALLTLIADIKSVLTEKKSALGEKIDCASVFGLDGDSSPNFNPSSESHNNVQVKVGNRLVKAGSAIDGSGSTVRSLYLSDAVQLGSSAGANTNYLATLYIQTNPSGFLRRPREIASLSMEVDHVSGRITQCHILNMAASAKEACSRSFGMRWSEETNHCNQAMADDSAITTFDCPPGFAGAPPDCHPIASSCASGQIARSFNLGRVKDCTFPPTTVSGIVARAPEDLSRPEDDPAPPPTPAPLPVQPMFAAPSVVITEVSTAEPPPAASCSNGSAVSTMSADACDGSPSYSGVYFQANSCSWPTSPTVANSCEVKPAVTYKTPNLAIVQPDPPAPADLSCQCNSRRIANGEFCMFCIRDADLGYGYADFSYGVTKCSSGNLVDVPSPTLGAPISACNNNYGRAVFKRGGFYQYNESQ